MIIGIATENVPKVNACKTVVNRLFPDLTGPHTPQFFQHKTQSGVSDMPMSQLEMMRGAQNRALNLYSHMLLHHMKPDYVIGLEGGFFNQSVNGSGIPEYFLQSWVFVSDGKKGHWGCSGAVPVPESVFKPVIESGAELAVVIDQVSGKTNVRSEMGAVGIFTAGRVDRQTFFETALEFAFAPFYNPIIYR